MGSSFVHTYTCLLNDEAQAKKVFDYFHKVGNAIKDDCSYFDIRYIDNRFDISSGGYGFLPASIVAKIAEIIDTTGFLVAETIYSCQGDFDAEAFIIGNYIGPTEVEESNEVLFAHDWWPCGYELQLHNDYGMRSDGSEFDPTLDDGITFSWNDLKFLPLQCRYEAFRELVRSVMNEHKMWGGHCYEGTAKASWDTCLHIREKRGA